MHLSNVLIMILGTGVAATVAAGGPAPVYPSTSLEELQSQTGLKTYPGPIPSVLQADAAAAANDGPALTRRRSAPGVYVCNKANWKGNCWWWPYTKKGRCQSWDNIKSFGPDQMNVCDIFEGENCKGKKVETFVTFPGIGDTRRNNLRSWRCGFFE